MKKNRDQAKTREGDQSVVENKAMGVMLLITVVAPRISSTFHAALIAWRKARVEYEESVRARSKDDQDLYQRLVETIKSTMDENLLKALCLYRWGGLSIDDVTDERILR
ncbi:hypothetical protein PF005_g6117 [Phytophthora fragariae]|uniref:Uncharacterized protein n=1 Tax=Phytophthora fragariae TaxID=53985 RepID=A0A6A3FJ62_9STRA|nr:hypothetical protein PF003_g10484 [Phytophthora fragariae]KAE8944411.1 hypothetical protein PF009_g5904 [Phytophthora fragariae]KAE9020800.1 hypothetical protein PF011_g5234 [Phytophthora fragariae]KAE9124084.1 hypothetical protein PF007_g6839 [Phytophthora fragariae]KAE9127485.1 hypothetical protein PF010_g4873 [Phytophthora fragariae]